MNAAHLHLVLTHIPVFSCAIGFCLLTLALIGGSRDLHLTSLAMLAVAGLLTIPTYLSGQPANALLTKLFPSTPMDAGDQHAEIAVVALTLALVLCAAAILTLVMTRGGRKGPTWWNVGLWLFALLTTATMIWTASLGGHIRHSEIRANTEKVGQ